MDCIPPGFSVHGILQTRILEWVPMPSFKGSPHPRDQTPVSDISYTGGMSFTTITWEVPYSLALVQFSSVTHSCLTFCDPMDCSMPGLPVHHQLPELAQTHVHGVDDAIEPSHPLAPPSPPAFNFSQHQSLFQ